MNVLLALLCCNTCDLLDNNYNEKLSVDISPKVVIVGAGASGIAAATKLMKNGFTDVTILEAENRIGGRVYSVEFGDYMVDLGSQWVYGEKDNVVFELAWSLGLLERMEGNYKVKRKFFGSNGFELPEYIVRDLNKLETSLQKNISEIEHLNIKSFGEYAELKYSEYFKKHLLVRHLSKALLHNFNLGETITENGRSSWYDISIKGVRDYAICDGDDQINWKNRSYNMILDILMEKYPHPNEQLPLFKNTHKSNKVTEINYNGIYNSVKISTADGREYLANHVIFTPSLGVMKSKYHRLFNPPLPNMMVKAIKNIGFSHAAKIWLHFDENWWFNNDDKFIMTNIYWTDSHRESIENDPVRHWMLGIHSIIPVEHKSKLLCMWVSGEYAMEMELISKKVLYKQTLEILDRFYGRSCNVTRPIKIIRSKWNINENFQGTYSFPALSADLANVNYADLAEPIMWNEKPIVQFAGEATTKHFSTVHGAIESGWREANRLIKLYS